MCGIVGLISQSGAPIQIEVILTMRDQLTHRGPDDHGIYTDSVVGFGHTRLSILDLSSQGHQPMGSEDGQIWLVYNGEVYNFKELRQELEGLGSRFCSNTDTEVVLRSFQQWGEACVHRFNGMFAFAVWDGRRKRLLLARDRLGVKPLFYYSDQGRFAFASELKSLLRIPNFERELDWEAISDFLSMNYIPPPASPFRRIRSLPPGHLLSVEDRTITLKKYWDIDYTSDVRSEPEMLSAIDEEIRKSLRKRLVADVPVGAFLSGGLDSSTVVSLMKEWIPDRLKTFNVSFRELSYDESRYAKNVAEALGTEHFEVPCRPMHLRSHFNDLVWHSDGLAADASNLALYLVSQLASEHVKVVLTGDGADEVFAGYPTYVADRLAAYYRRLPGWFRRGPVPFLAGLLPASDHKLSLESKVKRFVEGAQYEPGRAHYYWRIIFNDSQKQRLIAEDMRKNIMSRDSAEAYLSHFSGNRGRSDLQRGLYADLKVFLAGSILPKVDNMSMAHSLEARSPFLDFELVELMAKVPLAWKLRGFQTKRLLRTLMRDRLPPEITHRPKAGFNLPLQQWFRTELRDFVDEVLSRDAIQSLGFLDWRGIENLKQEHFSGKMNHDLRLWGLMNLVRWYHLFVKC